MRVCILSDLHLEKHNIKLIPIQCDIMILAGDIGTGTMAKDFMLWHLENGVKHILYVLGNHEFYDERNLQPSISTFFNDNNKHHDSYQYTLDALEKLDNQIERLHVLHNKEFIYQNVRFLGTTLWTDFDRKIENERNASYNMNDYIYITYKNRYLEPHDVFNFHIKAKKWLVNNLESKNKESQIYKTFVISHHLPSYKCVNEKYKNDILNPCFASNLDNLMETYKIDYWVHGHTHTSVNLKIKNTQVICNPRGYCTDNYVENPYYENEYMLELN